MGQNPNHGVTNHRAKNWALLTCGPSLYTTWTQDHYELYDWVVAVNQSGKMFWHDCLYRLDGARRIFGNNEIERWETTLAESIQGRQQNCNWSYTFPHALEYCCRHSPEDAHIHIYGLDHGGIKPIENAVWVGEGRTGRERAAILQVAADHPGKITAVFGDSQQWAIDNGLCSALVPLPD